MKGLLRKDLYMMGKYCRSYLLLVIVFLCVSVFSSDNLFFVFYPSLSSGMIPVSLLAYDERSRWTQYSGTLPYTKGQLVSGKYIIGLMAQIAVLIATGIAQALRMNRNGIFRWDDFAVLMLVIFGMAAVISSISLPFMFKLGVEKGRVAYYVMIGIACMGSVAASNLFRADWQGSMNMQGVLPVIVVAGIGVYVLSWYLSIVFYQKRETV